MPQHKVVTDANGRMRTVEVAPPKSAAEMERFRRDIHDHISGNAEPWHVDPNAKPKPQAESWSFDLTEGPSKTAMAVVRMAEEMAFRVCSPPVCADCGCMFFTGFAYRGQLKCRNCDPVAYA